MHLPWSSVEPLEPGQLSWEQLGWQEPPLTIVSAENLAGLGAMAQAKGYLWVQLEPPGPHYRGRLGLFIEEAIEGELESRGGLSPGIQVSTGLDASLSDQLYRARLLELRGIALGFPSLEGIANLGRTLDADDSSVLRWWMAASVDRPVRLLLDERNTCLRVYDAPVPFESLFETVPRAVSPRAPSVEMAESAATMELSDLPPRVTEAGVGASVDDETSAGGTVQELTEDDFSALDRALGLSPLGEAEMSRAAAWGSERMGTVRSEPLSAFPLPSVQPSLFPSQISNLPPVVSSEELAPAEVAAHPTLPAPPQGPAEVDTDVETPWVRGVESAVSGAARRLTPADFRVLRQASVELDGAALLRSFEEGSEAKVPSAELQVAPAESPAVAAPEPRFTTSDLEPAAASLALEEVAVSSSNEEGGSDRLSTALPPAGTPTPLPTRTIRRNPFIRLAEEVPTEARVFSAPSSEPLEPISGDGVARDIGADVAAMMDIGAHEGAVQDNTVAWSAMREAGTQEMVDVAVATEEGVSDPVEVTKDESLAPPRSNVSGPVPLLDPAKARGPVRNQGREVDRTRAFIELAERECATWIKNLDAARGPKPLAVIERMFVTDYTRLAEAVRLGVADEKGAEALRGWQESFAQSYAEAFDALRVRGKRPTMVLDVPELAQRLARLQGARRVQLLLVDGMRFDLGLMIQDRLKERAEAALTERLLLWSALPTCTAYQLELLGRGPDGLKEPGSLDEPPALVARGRAAFTPRRVRTGQLELLKLDVIEDELRQAGAPLAERLPDIADKAAEAIVDCFSKLPPRTMVVVFGDHGFTLDPEQAGTTAEVRQGGSTPEEVLVPAFAWLTGAVH